VLCPGLSSGSGRLWLVKGFQLRCKKPAPPERGLAPARGCGMLQYLIEPDQGNAGRLEPTIAAP
jgi:hypothetical protein